MRSHPLPAVPALVLLAVSLGAACGQPGVVNKMDAITSLRAWDTKVGGGAEAQAGTEVTVEYTGWLYDPTVENHHGRKFDSSKDHGEPFTLKLGAGQVIQGWDEGVEGMKVGGTRTLIVPPQLGYGARGAGGVIPPNATLVFEVELVAVKALNVKS
jgi:FKBP-type peptidyl-prolyl cis-trans isomerase FkpA